VSGGSEGALGGVLEAARSWLVEPPVERQPCEGVHPVVAVFGLGPGCGTTTVARALALELAARTGGVAAVAGEVRGGLPLASPASVRLAHLLADVPAARTRAIGRLCLVGGPGEAALADTARHHAPLVFDAGCAELGGVAASVADRSLVVATPRTEPALAVLAAGCLARIGRDPLVVLNRSRAGEDRVGTADVELPSGAAAARLACAGHRTGGRLGRAVGSLAELLEDRSRAPEGG
jgi:hypothetical protein